ncbi:hypothetical protein BH11MYX4_BH11MYX4_28610 [soil metagenome]
MKRRFVLMMGLALVGGASHASAHEGEPGRDERGAAGNPIDARATAAGNRVEGSVVVRGTVAALKAGLYRLERWPDVFSDARVLKQNDDGTWSVDFRRFGHPHDFRITRTAVGVVFDLAAKDHGSARLEYTLEPIDANRSRLTIRLLVPTPPQLTTEQAIDMLRTKAQSDLDDFSNRASAQSNGR